MSYLNHIFNSFTATPSADIKERKLAVKENVLDPVLQLFTKTPSNDNDSIKRLTEIEKQELIADCSVLEKGESKSLSANSAESLTALLAQIHADALIRDTSLESLPTIEGIIAWKNALKEIKEVTIPDSLIEALTQYEKFSAQIHVQKSDQQEAFKQLQELTRTIYNLKAGESFLLEGGRRENQIDLPILYEFIRTPANTFDLYVYLEGKSDTYCREQIEENGRKNWHRSIIYYKDIPADTHLFFANSEDTLKPDFFQTLLEPRALSGDRFNAEYVSLHLLGHLQVFRKDLEETSSQRQAFSDAWSSIKPFVMRRIGKQEYKKAIFEIKLNTLLCGYERCKTSLKDDTPEAEKLRIVLKRGATLILKNLASLHKNNVQISDALRLKAHASALDLLEKLEQMEKEIAQARKKKSHDLGLEEGIKTATLSKQYQDTLDNAKKEIKRPQSVQGSIVSTRARLIDLPSAETLSDQLISFTQAYKKDVKVARIRTAEIEHLVAQMPIPTDAPTDFWNRIPQEHLSNLLDALDTLVVVYTSATGKKNEGLSPRECNTAYALYAVIHYLALRKDSEVMLEGSDPKGSLAHYASYFPDMDSSDQDAFLLFPTPEDYERRKAIVAYFKNTYLKAAEKTKTPEVLFDLTFQVYIHSDRTPNGLGAYLLALANDSRFGDQLNISHIAQETHYPTAGVMITKDSIKKGWLASVLGEHLSPDKKDKNQNLLAAKGFSHVTYLARAAYTAHVFSIKRNYLRDDCPFKMNSSFQPHLKLGVIPTGFTTNIYANFYHSYGSSDSANLHPVLRKDQKKLLERQWALRKKTVNTTYEEAQVLQNVENTQDKIAEEITFLRASCEPSLFPHKLLAYYRAKLNLVESYEEQELFEIAFFRSVAIEPTSDSKEINFYNVHEWDAYRRERSFPLAEEMKQKGFRDQVQLFIQEGLDRYFLRQPNKRPKVLPATFFVRLACRLSRFADNSPLIDSLEYLENMLAIPDLTEEERSLLSLHLVYAYSTESRGLTQEEVEKIFGAWVYYKNTSLPEAWRCPLLEKEAETFIHKTSAFLDKSKDPQFHRGILKTALNQMGIVLPSNFAISAIQPHLIQAKGFGGQFWEVNLLTAEVMCPDGLLRRTKAPQGLAGDIFTYLFGNFNPSYLESKGAYYFSHPKFGTLRALKDNYNSHYKIQRQIDGEWYQYVSPGQLSKIPHILRARHTHWLNIDEFKRELKICNHPSGVVIAQINQSGEIVDVNSKEHYWGLSEKSFLSQFERPEYILRTEGNGKKKLVFSRYMSQSHQTLCFEQEGNSFVFTANRKYLLSPQQFPALLGATNGSLVLTHKETGHQKVLVALKPLAEHHPLSKDHAIDVVDRHVRHNSLGEFYTNQKNRFEYLEFDVKNGTLQPLTQEGICYLIYQYLAQRRYQEAFHYLKQIDFRERLSEQSQAYLIRSIELASASDHSPEAAALALHSFIICKKAADRAKVEGRSFSAVPSIANIKKTYTRFEHQIPELFLLTEEDQKLCLIHREGEKCRHYYPNIQRFLTIPESTLSQIEKIELHNEFGFNENSPLATSDLIKEVIRANQEIVKDATYFLPWESTPSNYEDPYLLSRQWTKEFERDFFIRAYEIATQGNDLERKRLNLRLQATAAAHSTTTTSWDILQLALKHPEKAPKLPTHLDSYQERLDFINACAEVMEQLRAIDSANDHSNHFISVETLDKEPKRTLIAPQFFAKKVEDVQVQIHLQPFTKEQIDRDLSQTLFSQFFTKDERVHKGSVDFPNKIEEETLTQEEKEFKTVLEKEFKEFSEDCLKGKEINENREFYKLEKPQELQVQLQEEIQTLDKELAKLEASLLELANKHDPDDRKQSLYKDAKITQELSLKRLADLFLQADADRFAALNPYLRDKRLIQTLADGLNVAPHDNLVIDYLYNTIGLYMTIHVQRTRLQRSVELCKKIAPLKESDKARDSLVQKLSDELKTPDKPIYSIQKNPEFLVFEYLSGLAIRGNQASLLIKLLKTDINGHYINRVIQLIMGGGKTSVLAVVLLRLAAKKGRLSLFVTPASQYTSVSFNLRKTLRDCFGLDMEEIETTREQLSKSPEMCKEILDRVKHAIDSGDFLLIKSETLLTIGLTFLDFIYQSASATEEDKELLKKINLLKDFLHLLRKSGDGLFDEIDLLLNVLQEVNFPIGEAQSVSCERIEVIRELFSLFMQTNVVIDENGTTANLYALIALRENRQNLLTKYHWKHIVAKAIAWNMPRTVESLKLQNKLSYCDSFYRYITGTMSQNCQKALDGEIKDTDLITPEEQHDFEFLSYVKDLIKKSKDPADNEAAHHIALIKHMVESVLPVTFEKNGKRHFGRGGTKPGEVRPYQAVDTPSDNLIGYHWEAIAYHFQTSLICGIDKEQLLHLASIYKAEAEIHSDKEKIPFDETLEAIEFKNLTKVALHELDNPQKVEEALRNLNENLDAILKFEADTAAELVTFYSLRLTATGQTLVHMLATVRAMSGTPWNIACYPSSLAKFKPAKGTEGQIADMLLSRVASKEKDKTYVHTLKTDKMTDHLIQLLDGHPQKERVRILMDSGALFKDFSNLEVAKALRDHLKKPVLFFMRNPRINEKTPDTLAILKVGSDQPDIIGGTRLDDIQKTGYNLEDYFVFADERHTTGTDIPLIPDAIGLMTLDEAMLRRSFFQTVMRERDFFLNQDVEFIIPEYLVEMLKKQCPEQKSEDLRYILSALLISTKNQAIAISKHYYRSCKQKIDEVFKENLFNELLIEKPLTFKTIQEIFTPYQKTVLVPCGDAPYDSFGRLEYPVDSNKTLKAYADRKLSFFPVTHPRRAEIEKQIKEILAEAAESPYRPEKVMDAGSQDLGIQVDILAEVGIQVEQQTQQEVEVDLLRELALYREQKVARLRPEQTWSDQDIAGFLDALRKDEIPAQTGLCSLSELLTKVNYNQKNYSRTFSSNIRVTESWALATERFLPVFHKMQRPMDQLLIVKSRRGYQAIALAQKEARQFKAFLAQEQNGSSLPDVWLIQPDASLLQDTAAGALPVYDKEIQKILVECNAFNGRIDYLEAHDRVTTDWLYEENGQLLQIKKEFLKLKIANNPVQKKLFFSSEIFSNVQKSDSEKKYRWRIESEKTANFGKEDIQAITEETKNLLKGLNSEQLNLMLPHQVDWLLPSQIPCLKKQELIQKIPLKYAERMSTQQMDKLAAFQVPWFEQAVVKTQAIPASFCQHMTDEQIKLLSPNQVTQLDQTQIKRVGQLCPHLLAHISKEQVKNKWIEKEHVPHLRKREAIEELSEEWQQLLPETLKPIRKSEVKTPSVSKQAPTTAPTSKTPLKPTAPAKQDQKKTSITRVVLTILAALVSLGILSAGAFAILGATWGGAPQFTITVYQAFQSPLFMPITWAGVGTLLLVSLSAYAIHHCRKKN